jgi:uncharacterized protein
MRIAVRVADSPIHGQGCFVLENVPRGTLVWKFSSIFDRIILRYTRERVSKEEQVKLFHRCYANPRYPEDWIMCGDEAQFLNFPAPPEVANIKLGGVVDGQDVLFAARDIEAGEELTVPPESDALYDQKMVERETGR